MWSNLVFHGVLFFMLSLFYVFQTPNHNCKETRYLHLGRRSLKDCRGGAAVEARSRSRAAAAYNLHWFQQSSSSLHTHTGSNALQSSIRRLRVARVGASVYVVVQRCCRIKPLQAAGKAPGALPSLCRWVPLLLYYCYIPPPSSSLCKRPL